MNQQKQNKLCRCPKCGGELTAEPHLLFVGLVDYVCRKCDWIVHSVETESQPIGIHK